MVLIRNKEIFNEDWNDVLRAGSGLLLLKHRLLPERRIHYNIVHRPGGVPAEHSYAGD